MSVALPAFSVLIPTYSRESLVRRAIASALKAAAIYDEEIEIIVVDDASPEPYLERIRTEFPVVRTFRMDRNGGPGPARNRGLREARAPWALCLDDDDTLRADAFAKISAFIKQLGGQDRSPVLQMACSNASATRRYQRVSFADFLNGKISGDWVPIIQVRQFLELGFGYPETGVGGENLLWFEIASRFGIPTQLEVVSEVSNDAGFRLCSVDSQLRNPSAYAELQEKTLAQFGGEMRDLNPAYYRMKIVGAAVYRILARQRQSARSILRRHADLPLQYRAACTTLSYLPHRVVVALFRFHRRSMAS